MDFNKKILENFDTFIGSILILSKFYLINEFSIIQKIPMAIDYENST